MPFCVLKGHLLLIKRAPFDMQKGIFYNPKGRSLFSNYELMLHL